jgi:hypothetical protein
MQHSNLDALSVTQRLDSIPSMCRLLHLNFVDPLLFLERINKVALLFVEKNRQGCTVHSDSADELNQIKVLVNILLCMLVVFPVFFIGWVFATRYDKCVKEVLEFKVLKWGYLALHVRVFSVMTV